MCVCLTYLLIFNFNFHDRINKPPESKISQKSIQRQPSSSLRTDTGTPTDMKIIVAFRNFAKAPKNGSGSISTLTLSVKC